VIDYWKLTKGFGPGDVVQQYLPTINGISPFVGRVVAVHPGIGFVDVMWPFGVVRESPEDLVKIDPRFLPFLPPPLDFGMYSSVEMKQARAATGTEAAWNHAALPPSLYKDVSSMMHAGRGEVEVYDEMWHKYASRGVDDEALRGEVRKLYTFARKANDLRIQQHAVRTSAYWVAQNRQYRVTQGEMDIRRPGCPKCKTSMRRTTYRMEKGARVRLFACPKCLFLIKRDSLLDPSGNPVGW